MKKLLQSSNWLTGILILFMPIALIYFLGSQMAYRQVQDRHATYTELPEISRLTELQSVANGETVLIRGELVDSAKASTEQRLLIYQERPLDGREVRFREEFSLVFPALTLVLDDGTIEVQPGSMKERTISHEIHRIAIDDREFTGFQAGDTVTIQGKLQLATDGQAETGSMAVGDVTGISGVDKAALLADVQVALNQVSQVRNGLGLVTLLSIALLAVQLTHRRKNRQLVPTYSFDDTFAGDEREPQQEAKEWPPATRETVSTI